MLRIDHNFDVLCDSKEPLRDKLKAFSALFYDPLNDKSFSSQMFENASLILLLGVQFRKLTFPAIRLVRRLVKTDTIGSPHMMLTPITAGVVLVDIVRFIPTTLTPVICSMEYDNSFNRRVAKDLAADTVKSDMVEDHAIKHPPLANIMAFTMVMTVLSAASVGAVYKSSAFILRRIITTLK
jgi:hypothetical protein